MYFFFCELDELGELNRHRDELGELSKCAKGIYRILTLLLDLPDFDPLSGFTGFLVKNQ